MAAIYGSREGLDFVVAEGKFRGRNVIIVVSYRVVSRGGVDTIKLDSVALRDSSDSNFKDVGTAATSLGVLYFTKTGDGFPPTAIPDALTLNDLIAAQVTSACLLFAAPGFDSVTINPMSKLVAI